MAEHALARGTPIVGPARKTLGEDLAATYKTGVSIRALAEEIGRSYSFVRSVLRETGVQLRSRGGNVRQYRRDPKQTPRTR